MPSFFSRFANFSCLNDSAVEIAKEQEMLNAFAGRESPSHDDGKGHCEEIVAPSVCLPTKAVITTMNHDHNNSTRSGRSIYTATSRRRSTLRSTMSRADSYRSTTSGISIRSSPWYMTHISPSVIFWNGEHSHRTTAERTSVPMLDDTKNDEHEVTTEDCDGSEEEEYIFCDSSGSDVTDRMMTNFLVNKNITDCCIAENEETFQLSSILGSNIVREAVEYDTNQTLLTSALIGLYFAKFDQCQQTTEYVNLFAAGYYHPSVGSANHDANNANELQALTVVFCNANANTDDDDLPTNLPSNWYTLSKSESNSACIKQGIMKEFDIVTTAGPTFVIFDPRSGHIVCSNAILEIMDLDRSDADQYDADACQLYDSWLQQLPTASTKGRMSDNEMTIRYEQLDVEVDDEGLVTVEYIDGVRSSYERSLPYSV